MKKKSEIEQCEWHAMLRVKLASKHQPFGLFAVAHTERVPKCRTATFTFLQAFNPFCIAFFFQGMVPNVLPP